MNRLLLTLPLLLALLASCQESLEDKAARDAQEYTRKYCPTPVINYTRTDSVSFSKTTHIYTYYCSFCDLMDDAEIITANKERLQTMLEASVRENTALKPYIEAGFTFRYICRSDKDPKTILYKTDIKAAE